MVALSPSFAHFSIAAIGLDGIGRRFVPREIAESARSSSVFIVGMRSLNSLHLGSTREALIRPLVASAVCEWQVGLPARGTAVAIAPDTRRD
jgi:hypothetical protein